MNTHMEASAEPSKQSAEGDDFVEHTAPTTAAAAQAHAHGIKSGDGWEMAEMHMRAAASPSAVEPEVGTTAGFGYSYDDDDAEGFAASGMMWDSESRFPYRAEQEETSVLARMVKMVSSVASSGVAARYAPLSGAVGTMQGLLSQDDLEQKWQHLESLVPGLTHGALLLGHVEFPGHGTVAQTSAPLPNCERGTFSTTVDDKGCVTSAWVDSDMPLDAPERIEIEVPGAGGGEAGAPHAAAKLVFTRDAGAQQLARELVAALQEQEKTDTGSGRAEEDDSWLAPGRPWHLKKEDHLASSFIFDPALPLGSLVTKVQHGRVLVLGEFYQWEVLEMLVRFTVMFFFYAFCVFSLLGFVFKDRDKTPQPIMFLLLASKSQDNLSFYAAFLFQIVFLYATLMTLSKARRLVRASALDELYPVKGFLVCVGYHRGDGGLLGKSLAAALSQAGISVWCEDIFTQNAAQVRPQIHCAAHRACFQVVIVTAGMLSSPSSCLHILEALRRPAARSVFYIDPAPEVWEQDGLGRPLGEGHAQRLVDALTALGMRVVTCPKQLVLHVDSLMLNPMAGTAEEKILSEWWSRSKGAAGQVSRTFENRMRVTLSRPGRSWSLPLGRSMHANLKFTGKMFRPAGCMSSGFAYIHVQPAPKESRSSAQVDNEAEGDRAAGAASPSGAVVKLRWGGLMNLPVVGLLLLALVVGLGGYILLGPYGAPVRFDAVLELLFRSSSYTCPTTAENKAYVLRNESAATGNELVGDGEGYLRPAGAGGLLMQTFGVPKQWCWAPLQGCCQRCSAINDNPDLKFWCHAFTTLIPPADESAGSDKAEKCRLVLSHRAERVPSEPLSPAGGWSSLEGKADGWAWQEEEGAVSGVPLWDEDLVGAVPPYFSLLQIIALFIACNAPVAIWRFFDCRLTHSPEILPLLVAAHELRRRKASLLIFAGAAREEAGGWRALTGLADFLASCHLPVASLGALDDEAAAAACAAHDKSFYVLCIDSPAAARLYRDKWNRVRADRMLLVIDPAVYRAVPELRVLESVHLRPTPGFLKELLQVMGMKLGRFCHGLQQGAPGAEPAAAATIALDDL